MKIKQSVFGLLVIMAVTVSACGVSTGIPEATPKDTPTAEAMMEKDPDSETMMDKEPASEEMMAEESPTAEAMMEQESAMGKEPDSKEMMAEESPTAEAMMEQEAAMEQEADSEEMMAEESPTAEAMMEQEDSTPEAMMEEDAAMSPAWYGVELTNVTSGTTFKVADLQGKVVLVETLAVWCSNCLRQQREVQALHELLGPRDDYISLGLDIDPNETPDILKAHAEKHSFDWRYAVAPVEVAREIGQLYGDQFLNPPSTPMLIIDRQGQAHPLPFGIKSAQTLQETLGPYLN
jgi:hypothetical protein